jgi:hypothetical protein
VVLAPGVCLVGDGESTFWSYADNPPFAWGSLGDLGVGLELRMRVTGVERPSLP